MQISFGMFEDQHRRQKKGMLDEIGSVIDFGKIEKLLLEMYVGTTGRPPIPPLILFKALLLESWYNLSDVEVVQEIHDRRSFERFVGADVRKYHVDDTTLVRFRERMRDARLIDRVWKEIQKQLERKGFLVKKGTIVDSTLVKGACKPESKNQEGGPVDPDVHYTSRNGKAVDGMKVHVGLDQGSGVIRKMEISHIEKHDHEYLKPMIRHRTKMVFADKAYASHEHDEYLERRKIKNGILSKGYRDHPLTLRQERRNWRLSRVRSIIEPKMNDLKNWCSMARMRYYGLVRNRLWVLICGIACNGKRAIKLQTA